MSQDITTLPTSYAVRKHWRFLSILIWIHPFITETFRKLVLREQGATTIINLHHAQSTNRVTK